MSTTSMEDVAQAVGSSVLRFFQLYIIKDREYTRELLQSEEVLRALTACTCLVGAAAASGGECLLQSEAAWKHSRLPWGPGQPCLDDS